MEKTEKFLLLKLTSQKPKTIIAVSIGIVVFGIFLVNFAWDPCNIEHTILLQDIAAYEQSLDPEFCESVLERIDNFNEECDQEIEILDCG